MTVLLDAPPASGLPVAVVDEPAPLVCEVCDETDPAEFTAHQAGDTDGDQLCDDCHNDRQETRCWDDLNYAAYHYH